MAPLEREEQYYHILYELDHVLLKDQPSSMLKAKQILAMVHSRLAKHEPSTIGKKKRQVKSWSDPNSMISTITYMAKAVRPEYEGMTRKQNKSRSVVYVHGSAALDLTKVFKKYPNYVRDLRDHHQRLKSPQLPAQAPQRPDAATGFASLQSLPFPVKVQTSGLNGMRLVPQPQHQSSATDQDRLDSWNARYTPTQLGNLIHGGTYDVLAGKSADILNGELRELLDHRGGTGNNQLSSDQFENAFKELNSLHHLFFSLFDNTTRSIDGIEAEDLPLLARCLYDIFPGACRSVYGSNSDPETMVKSTQQSRLYLPDIFVALMQASTLQSLADMMPLSWRLARGTRIETYQHYMLRDDPLCAKLSWATAVKQLDQLDKGLGSMVSKTFQNEVVEPWSTAVATDFSEGLTKLFRAYGTEFDEELVGRIHEWMAKDLKPLARTLYMTTMWDEAWDFHYPAAGATYNRYTMLVKDMAYEPDEEKAHGRRKVRLLASPAILRSKNMRTGGMDSWDWVENGEDPAAFAERPWIVVHRAWVELIDVEE